MNYICEGLKYTYTRGYIMLPVKLGELPKTVRINNDELSLKGEFHVSLVCVKNILSRYDQPDLEQRILDYFCNFTGETDISFEKFTGEFRLAQNGENKTLVALCEVSNLDKLVQSMGADLGIDIPRQPTHVTLYTLEPNVGIGLNSPEELEEKAVQTQVPKEVQDRLGIA